MLLAGGPRLLPAWRAGGSRTIIGTRDERGGDGGGCDPGEREPLADDP
jgi:hypothetical protein